MLAFRSFVAVLVAVLTLLGGAFRAPAASAAIHTIHGRLAIERASHDNDQGTLDRGRAGVQFRATKASGPHVRDSFGASTIAMRPRVVVDRSDGSIARLDPVARAFKRRVRVHAENMVFLN